MKRSLLILSLSFLMVLPALGQEANDPERTPEKRAEKITERMSKNLNLTEDQKAAVYNANLKRVSAEKEQRSTTLERYDADMKEILSEEQYEKWRTMRKERHNTEKTGKGKMPKQD